MAPPSSAAATAAGAGDDDGAAGDDYLFGFGSIINRETHAAWLPDNAGSGANGEASTGTNGGAHLPGQVAALCPSLGYRRGWNFRSNTGFTALGVVRDEDAANEETGGGSGDGYDGAAPINGVLFRLPRPAPARGGSATAASASAAMLEAFDRREVGYDRVAVPHNGVLLYTDDDESDRGTGGTGRPGDNDAAAAPGITARFTLRPRDRVWIYVPQPQFCLEADVDHPILQSYVDTVLQGCLEFGGETMARAFIATTGGWSRFFLNDTPSSRRPWLYRKQYDVIDRLLRESAERTFVRDRRHPEAFSKAFLHHMRGAWGLPGRNPAFTGRDATLGTVHARLVAQRTAQGPTAGLARLEVAGMGGVGKTSLAVEYCYRYFPSYYGLVVWLSAVSAESVLLGYRQLMADTTDLDVHDKSAEDVVAEVKTRLFRSKVPWLLVFDNLEDRSLLAKFLPHGGSHGHVLVTTRVVDADAVDEHRVLALGCLQPAESMDFLGRAAGERNVQEGHRRAAKRLADRLGHLPLALGVAAAYMKRCDVDCSEYLSRYEHSEGGGAALGHQAVSSSLALSLDAIGTENAVALEALLLVSFLGPDNITKPILRSLLVAKHKYSESKASASMQPESGNHKASDHANLLVLAGSCSLLMGGMLLAQRRRVGMELIALSTASAVLYYFSVFQPSRPLASGANDVELDSPSKKRLQSQGATPIDVFEQTDQVWKILKSYSLLDIKEGKGSMHRLLSQAIRSHQNKKDTTESIEICLRAIQQLWSFKPDHVDSWQNASSLLDHVKAVISHAADVPGLMVLETAKLACEAGMFSAMALNRFEEAQLSLEQALIILESGPRNSKELKASRAACLHELGKVYRYQGNEMKAGEALRNALDLRTGLAGNEFQSRRAVAATLHELGILEVKNHNLEAAADFLNRSLHLRQKIQLESDDEETEAECAASLHQLAVVQVSMKPPSLDKAEILLREALKLNMNIGQRAATLKQLARVAIRNGDVDDAESYLSQALDLYVELFGENKLHINIAAVRFQQGALAYQREQLQNAWDYFSECLRARQQIYAYSQGVHLEVATVLHELGCVALAQKRYEEANELLQKERLILDELSETLDQHQRLFHIKLTNLTWLKKCAKLLGDDTAVRAVTEARAALKRAERAHCDRGAQPPVLSVPLQCELLSCRVLARQVALAGAKAGGLRTKLSEAMKSLVSVTQTSPQGPLPDAAEQFQRAVAAALVGESSSQRSMLLEACDDLRDTLRELGIQVNDSIQKKR